MRCEKYKDDLMTRRGRDGERSRTSRESRASMCRLSIRGPYQIESSQLMLQDCKSRKERTRTNTRTSHRCTIRTSPVSTPSLDAVLRSEVRPRPRRGCGSIGSIVRERRGRGSSSRGRRPSWLSWRRAGLRADGVNFSSVEPDASSGYLERLEQQETDRCRSGQV